MSLETVMRSSLIFELVIKRHLRTKITREVFYDLEDSNLQKDMPIEIKAPIRLIKVCFYFYEILTYFFLFQK